MYYKNQLKWWCLLFSHTSPTSLLHLPSFGSTVTVCHLFCLICSTSHLQGSQPQRCLLTSHLKPAALPPVGTVSHTHLSQFISMYSVDDNQKKSGKSQYLNHFNQPPKYLFCLTNSPGSVWSGHSGYQHSKMQHDSRTAKQLFRRLNAHSLLTNTSYRGET